MLKRKRHIVAANASFFWFRQNESAGQIWESGQAFTVQTSDRLQKVVVNKTAEMQSDYSDVRFVINPDGTAAQRKYLSYWIEASDAISATIWVGFKTAPQALSQFYAIYGNPDADSVTSGYKAFFDADYFYNDFTRGIDYDVVNVLGGYDLLLAGDANGEETWPAGWQHPDDRLHCGVIYKRQDTNLHAGNPTTRTAMRITTDGWQTFGSETVIDNPDSEYDSTSSTSIAIPTTHPSERTFTIEAGKPWQANDTGQARASDTQYFDFTVVSYSGTTLVVNSNNHVGTGTLTTWVISKRIGATNAVITAVKMSNGTTRLIMLNSHVDYTITTGSIRVGTKYSDDLGQTWTTWTQRGPDQWINVGGQAITMNNGYVVLSAHQNAGFEGMTEHTLWFFISRDYGVTWSTHTVQLAGVYLDEVGMFQKKNTDSWLWVEDTIKVICRVENTPFHYYTFDVTVTASSASNTTPVENNFYVDEQSRLQFCWSDDIIWGFFGDVREQAVFSLDSGDTWFPVPFTTIEGNVYSSRRVYTVPYYIGNGKMPRVWTNNKLSGGADLYINYWDAYMMALRAISTNNFTDSRPRPTDLNPGLRVNGSLIAGYRTTSTTSNAVPTVHPTLVTFQVDAGLLYVNGEALVATNRAAGTIRFEGTVDSYSGTTLVVSSTSNTGTGTIANWVIDKISNLLSDQVLLSYWNRNGKLRPFKYKTRYKATNSGFFGLKKDETRATAVVTISAAGAAGDVITIKWSGVSSYAGLFTGVGKLATYTVQSGDNIADVVTGLVASANAIGISPVVTSDATTLTLQAPRGESTNINGRALTVVVTGTVAGSSGNFASGAAAETPTTLSNVIVIDKANDVVRIEQANDNHNQALANTDDVYQNYEITWEDDLVTVTDGTTTRTKGPATGSGIPDWPGQIFFHITTSVSAPWSYYEVAYMRTLPAEDTTATPGATIAGTWEENELGTGIE